MAEKNNKLPDDLDNTLDKGNLDQNDNKNVKKEQNEYFKLTAHNDAKEQLNYLRDFLGKESSEKKEHTHSGITHSHFAHQNKSEVPFQTIQTRQEGDANKNIFQGAAELIYTPFLALKDAFTDATRMVFSPVEETKRTIAYLEEESSAKII